MPKEPIAPVTGGILSLSVTVEGQPRGWRQNHRAMKGTKGKGFRVQSFLTTNAEMWRKTAIYAIKTANADRVYFAGHVLIEVLAIYERPARLNRKADDAGRIPIDCKAKPDLTNVQKLAEDALVRAGVLYDDSLTNGIAARRYYAAKGEQPSVTITIRDDDGEN